MTATSSARAGPAGGDAAGPGQPAPRASESSASMSEPVQPGQHAEGRHPGAAAQLLGTGAEQGRVAAELVDDKALHRGAQVVRQEGDRAVQGREHAAPVDVARRRSPAARRRRATRRLTMSPSSRLISAGLPAPSQMHHVEAGPQVSRAGRRTRLEQRRLGLLVAGRVEGPPGAAHDDHLAGPIGLGLEQDGIHGHLGRQRRRPAPGPPGPARSRARSGVTAELSAMFWALNGATRTPRRASSRHRPVTTVVLPASLVVPQTIRPPRTIEAVISGPGLRPGRLPAGPARAASGTAMRTVPGRPKLAQSRTRMAAGGQLLAEVRGRRRAPSWPRDGRGLVPGRLEERPPAGSEDGRPRRPRPGRSTASRSSGRAAAASPLRAQRGWRAARRRARQSRSGQST